MGRQKLFNSAAERQRAYRKRQQALKEYWQTNAGPVDSVATRKSPRSPSRPKRAAALLAEVEKLQQEYETWQAAIPEPLQDGEQATRLAEAIEQLATIAELLSDLSLPRGFGRD